MSLAAQSGSFSCFPGNFCEQFRRTIFAKLTPFSENNCALMGFDGLQSTDHIVKLQKLVAYMMTKSLICDI